LHVVQANFQPTPDGLAAGAVLDRWHSLRDVAAIAASGGVRVTVVQSASKRDCVVRDGIEYHFVDIGDGATGKSARSRMVAGLLSDLRADVLHVHGLAFAGEAFAAARPLPRLPILCQDHADRPPRWWRTPQWRRWYSAVSAVAFTATAQARPFFDARVFPKRLPVFAIPESSSRFAPGDRRRARTETGIHGDPCVLWVGHLNAGKDPLAVIDGIARAAKRLPGLQLWCAFGSAPLLAEVQDRVRACPQLADRVHFLGNVPHAQVEALMRAADVFVSGSRSESCGYALLEALACGTAPVVTDIPSFRALTGGGAVGRLWPAGDAARLADALVEVASRRTPPTQVRTHFDATLSFDAVGRRWADAYAQVREQHARGRR
jgi:glycosyltransferase involved in cell wall biosynthesis